MRAPVGPGRALARLNEPALFYALAIPAVVMLGLAKGGFAGVGALSLPLVAMAISPVRAAAILLPILIVQDVVGVWAFRRDWDRYVLGWMLPGAVLGIVLGYVFAARVSERRCSGWSARSRSCSGCTGCGSIGAVR